MPVPLTSRFKVGYRLSLRNCSQAEWLACLKFFREQKIPLQSLLLSTLHLETVVEIGFGLFMVPQGTVLQSNESILQLLREWLQRIPNLQWSLTVA
jgi:hypothetical protein